jgi:phosphoenolpyruvate carboxykinase (ATP)
MITAALEEKLDQVDYRTHEIFGIDIPQSCPDVPAEILNPKDTWENKADYDKTAKKVAQKF